MTNDKMREAFETMLAVEHPNAIVVGEVTSDGDVVYGNPSHTFMWWGFKACHAHMLSQLDSPEMVEDAETEYNRYVDELGDQAMLQYCHEAPMKAALSTIKTKLEG